MLLKTVVILSVFCVIFIQNGDSAAAARRRDADDSMSDDDLDEIFSALIKASGSKLGLLSLVDSDDDEVISFDEFKNFLQKNNSSEEITDERAREYFNENDKNGDGVITADEIDMKDFNDSSDSSE